jgi:hypothetical protein
MAHSRWVHTPGTEALAAPRASGPCASSNKVRPRSCTRSSEPCGTDSSWLPKPSHRGRWRGAPGATAADAASCCCGGGVPGGGPLGGWAGRSPNTIRVLGTYVYAGHRARRGRVGCGRRLVCTTQACRASATAYSDGHAADRVAAGVRGGQSTHGCQPRRPWMADPPGLAAARARVRVGRRSGARAAARALAAAARHAPVPVRSPGLPGAASPPSGLGTNLRPGAARRGLRGCELTKRVGASARRSVTVTACCNACCAWCRWCWIGGPRAGQLGPPRTNGVNCALQFMQSLRRHQETQRPGPQTPTLTRGRARQRRKPLQCAREGGRRERGGCVSTANTGLKRAERP